MDRPFTRPTFTCEACGGAHAWTPATAGRMARCPRGPVVRVPDEPDVRDNEVELPDSRDGDDPPTEPEPRDLVYVLGRIKRLATSWYVAGPAMLLCGAGAIAWLQLSAWRHEAFVARAAKTVGVISQPADVDQGHGYARAAPVAWKFHFPVTYAVAGRGYETWVQIEGTGELPDGCNWAIPSTFVGHSVPIIYDPANPAHAETAASAGGFTMFYAYVIFGPIALVGLLLLWRRPP